MVRGEEDALVLFRTGLPRGVLDEGVWLRGRFVGAEASGELENLSFLVGVASKTGGVVVSMVGVASVGFLFLLVGVALESVRGDLVGVTVCFLGVVCDWCCLGGVLGCCRGDRRRVGVACDVGKVTRTTLSIWEETTDAEGGGV